MAKGVVKSTIKRDLKHSMYKDCLMDNQTVMCQMNCIQSDKHKLHLYTVNKQCLSPFDDKRYLLPNNCDTLAFGHFLINK